MSKLQEQDLIELGFKRTNVTTEESGDFPFYYFTYEFTDNYGLSLITDDDSSALENKGWTVSIFDYEKPSFTDVDDLRLLISIISKNLS
jgi:hypothetical protein